MKRSLDRTWNSTLPHNNTHISFNFDLFVSSQKKKDIHYNLWQFVFWVLTKRERFQENVEKTSKRQSYKHISRPIFIFFVFFKGRRGAFITIPSLIFCDNSYWVFAKREREIPRKKTKNVKTSIIHIFRPISIFCFIFSIARRGTFIKNVNHRPIQQ